MAIIFVTKGKTNWKYLAIVFILGLIVGAATLWLTSKQEMLPLKFPEIKKPEKIVEEEIICGVSDPLYCKNDRVCICEAGGCFMGNKHYYEKCVDKDKLCLDYCGLPGSTIISKCVQNKCTFELKTW